MKISMRAMAVDSFVPALEALGELLEKGEAHAKRKDLDLIEARLAPDMYNLAQQVQQACHYARDCTARLAGEDATAMPETGASFAELKAQIARTIEHMRSVPASAFEGAEERDCSIAPAGAGFTIEMNGLRFLGSWALPHFYFHVVTAYDIMRHEGVAIGKRDYMSWVGAFIRPHR